MKGSMHAEARFKETFTRNDIKEHSRAGDKWIVIQGKVYDISSFMKMHPGGENIIGSYVSQDATVSFVMGIMAGRDSKSEL